jgi:hypothetical protein
MLLVCADLVPQAAVAASGCAPAEMAKADVLGVINNLFAAFRTDSQDVIQQITTPDFYAYDGGMRFSAQAMFEFIKNGHASGKRWEWSVTEPDVHVACNVAWIAYVNRGFVEDSSGRQDMTWIESAILEYSAARWRIRFIHSTRAPMITPHT